MRTRAPTIRTRSIFRRARPRTSTSTCRCRSKASARCCAPKTTTPKSCELVTAGPADKAGTLKPSDRIIGVGQGESGKLIDVVGWRLDDVVELIRGPKVVGRAARDHSGRREDSKSRIVSITRNTVQLEEQSAQKKVLTLQQGGTTHKIGIIEIPTFYADFKAMQQGDPDYKSTTRDVHALIDQLKAEGVEGIIIDLRNNGGGSLQEADSLTGLFIKSGPTVQVKTANRRASIYADTDDDNRVGRPAGRAW